MNDEIIIRLLQNSGLHTRGMDSNYIYLEDPACIIRSFETFAEYAWLFITIVTGLLLFGWSLSMIRGAKNDIFTNLKNIILIFGILSLTPFIINMLWGGDLFGRGCRTVRVPLAEVQEILAARQERFGQDLYESFDIYDSGVGSATSMTVAPAPVVTSPGAPAPSAPSPVAPTPAPAPTPSAPDVTTPPVNNNSGALPVRASGSGKNVVYEYSDARRKTHVDGTRAWRNTNPGNIRGSQFATKQGAIGAAGGFAVFPAEHMGMAAIKTLMRSESYRNLTVAGAISRYAPPVENDTAAYHRQIEKLTGLSINKRVSDLTDAELDKLAHAIRQIEGWKPGDIIHSN